MPVEHEGDLAVRVVPVALRTIDHLEGKAERPEIAARRRTADRIILRQRGIDAVKLGHLFRHDRTVREPAFGTRGVGELGRIDLPDLHVLFQMSALDAVIRPAVAQHDDIVEASRLGGCGEGQRGKTARNGCPPEPGKTHIRQKHPFSPPIPGASAALRRGRIGTSEIIVYIFVYNFTRDFSTPAARHDARPMRAWNPASTDGAWGDAQKPGTSSPEVPRTGISSGKSGRETRTPTSDRFRG